MGKKNPSIKPVSASSTDASPKASVEPRRPGTSGTELLLTTNRRTASAQYVAAQRAETAYKAKKRSAGARQHRSEAKDHFWKAGWHLKEGLRSSCSMVAAVPWMLRGWREERQVKNERKAVEKFEKKKLKLEERIAKREAVSKKDEEKVVDEGAA
ncbi:hypothetical protein K458DRAFT_316721 [Lentithecium fluviatile CBS 122367]|uniref:Uncharacterized protein n=1 Tax=Lentithecium fluviatile CBS 122367 TaxID=1168545 RepID=A0A6G1IK03_9PLEO|nr:hypothetical protein K458DRAFT_316721 [Lentithecium fluviatile CBS 122367]